MYPLSSSTGLTTTTLQVRTSPTCNVTSLEVQTTGITRVVSLDSAHPINEPSDSNSTDPSPTLPKAKAEMTKVSSLERIAAQLQANQLMKSQSLEIKTEALPTLGPTLTTPTTRTSNSPVEHSPSPSNGASVTAQTLSKVNLNASLLGTGTGSVTATPTSYMTAVTTTASTTYAPTAANQESLLGKRVRKQSTKYEDYEQPPTVAVGGEGLSEHSYTEPITWWLNLWGVLLCRACGMAKPWNSSEAELWCRSNFSLCLLKSFISICSGCSG